MIEITRGNPSKDLIPFTEIAEACLKATSELKYGLHKYGSPYGLAQLRDFLAAVSGVGVDNVIVGNGAMSLFEIFIRSNTSQNDIVFVESPTYDFALDILREHKINIKGIQMTNQGLDLDQLRNNLLNITPKMLYVIPDFQNPTGATLSLQYRKELIELAEKYNFLIVEDVSYRFLRYSGNELPSLFDISPLKVIQIGSFSKTIAPSLRVGYMLGNDDIINRMAAIARLNYIFPSTLNQAIVYEIIQQTDAYASHLTKIRKVYGNNLNALIENTSHYLKEDASWFDVEGGFFLGLFVNLKDNMTGSFLQEAYKCGVELLDGRVFFPETEKKKLFIRLSFAGLNVPDIINLVKRLSKAIQNTKREKIP